MEPVATLELDSPFAELSHFVYPPAWVEPFISYTFLSFLSSMHYFVMASSDYERLMMPNTTSPLYNMSLYLNSSVDPRDALYKAEVFNTWGFPSDTFAVYFMRKSPQFILFLQFIVFGMLLCFGLMSTVLVYLTFFS